MIDWAYNILIQIFFWVAWNRQEWYLKLKCNKNWRKDSQGTLRDFWMGKVPCAFALDLDEKIEIQEQSILKEIECNFNCKKQYGYIMNI